MTVSALYSLYLTLGVGGSLICVMLGWLDLPEVVNTGAPTIATNVTGTLLLPLIAGGLGASSDGLRHISNVVMRASWPMALLAVACCSSNHPDIAVRVPLLVFAPLLLNWLTLSILLWKVDTTLDKLSAVAFQTWVMTLGPFVFFVSSFAVAIVGEFRSH